MGGDFGPRITIPAAIKVAQAYPNAQFFLVGDSTIFPSFSQNNISIVHADDVVAMDADPRRTLRQMNSTSMGLALSLVKEGKADGCVSAGNTGALILMTRHAIGTIEGIRSPAICKSMPAKSPTKMLDLGANIECSAEQLVQFSIMGSALATLDGGSSPTVGLLNIGSESTKGTTIIRETAAILAEHNYVNFQGFIEADDIFSGKVQVIVCDGYSGNIALKASQGVARFITDKFTSSLKSNIFNIIIAWCLKSTLKALYQEINPDVYNGATLLGLKKVVIKSHGSASELAFMHALEMAIEQVKKNVPSKISEYLNNSK